MSLSRRAMLAATPLLAAAPLLGAGCSSFNRPFPDKTIFVLEVERQGASLPARRPRALLMREVDAAAGAESRGLVTRLSGNRQTVDFWNEFALPPARLVDDRLRRWLAASGAVAPVLDAGSRAEADLVLETTLLALFADATDPARPQAVASLAMLLLDRARRPPRVLAQASFTERTPIASTQPQAIVAGLSASLAAVFAQVEQQVRTAGV